MSLFIECCLHFTCYRMALRVTDTLKEELEQGGSEFLPFTEESLVYKWMFYHHDDQVEKEFKQQQQLSFSSGGHHRTDSTEEEQELFPEALESSSLLQNTVWQEAATISSPSTLSSFSTSSTYSHTSQCASSFSSQTSAAASQNETTAGGSINSTISAFTPGKLLWPSLIRTHKQLLGIQEVSTILILSHQFSFAIHFLTPVLLLFHRKSYLGRQLLNRHNSKINTYIGRWMVCRNNWRHNRCF